MIEYIPTRLHLILRKWDEYRCERVSTLNFSDTATVSQVVHHRLFSCQQDFDEINKITKMTSHDDDDDVN